MKQRNIVAKHSRTLNKSVTMRDRKNDYSRRLKHTKAYIND